jgi:hypothetical protein
MPSNNLLIPAAILAAGAMIAAGLYFGLQSRGRGDFSPAAPSAQSPDQPPAIATPAATVKQQAASLLEAQHAEMAAKCWPANTNLNPMRYVFNFTFAPDGSQISRGVSEASRHPENPQAAVQVTRCLQNSLPSLKIAPPGGCKRFPPHVVCVTFSP